MGVIESLTDVEYDTKMLVSTVGSIHFRTTQRLSVAIFDCIWYHFCTCPAAELLALSRAKIEKGAVMKFLLYNMYSPKSLLTI